MGFTLRAALAKLDGTARVTVVELVPQIIEWARDEMANYKVPRAVEVLDVLPLNATGKVMKDDLRARVNVSR